MLIKHYLYCRIRVEGNFCPKGWLVTLMMMMMMVMVAVEGDDKDKIAVKGANIY